MQWKFALQTSMQVPHPAGLNTATRSERPFAVSGKLRLPACCCYMRLFSCHKHAQSHITVSFFPGKREDIFFFFAGSHSAREEARWGIKRRSGVAHDGTCCRGASILATVQLGGRFLGARGRPRSLPNSVVQTKVPGEGYPALHRSPIGSTPGLDQERRSIFVIEM
jgi:hypothetical protein